MPHPHTVGLLQVLVWDQQYRRPNAQCEGDSPETFEWREDLAANRLQVIEDWLQVEGYSYRFCHRRWRVWRLNPRFRERLCPNGCADQVGGNKYMPSRRAKVCIWDAIEKEFREP